MDASSTIPGSSESLKTDKLSHTPSGSPYVPLDTKSSIPIYLTPIYTTDVETLQATLAIPSLAAKLISVPQPYTTANAQFWIDLQIGGKCNSDLQAIRTFDPESGPLIGSASLMKSSDDGLARLRNKLPKAKGEVDEKEYELGYYLHPDWTGKGIMGAAVKAIVEMGKAEYGAIVVVRITEENAQSRKVVEKFKQFARDETRDDWVDWPVEKGGGRKKLLFWAWRD